MTNLARIFFVMILQLSVVSGNLWAQVNIDTLIDNYRQAVADNNIQQIGLAAQEIKKHNSALIYLKANDPKLYEKLESQVVDQPSAVTPQQTEALVSGPRVEIKKNDQPALPKIENPNYKKMVTQAKEFEKNLRSQMQEKAVVMTVSGLPRDERKPFLEILQKKFRKKVKWVMEEKFDNGYAQYWLELKDPKSLNKFAYELDGKRLDERYELDLTSLSSKKMDFILKLY